MDKRNKQLGMNPGTASGRLVKDLLFSFIKDRPCYRCGEMMERENFSIEHKTPWLDSENPLELYFSLENIDFSHHVCNIKAARKPHKRFHTEEERYENALKQSRDCRRKNYTSEWRHKRYKKEGR